METEIDFIFLGSKITADGDCSHEIKRCLLLRKQRHHFANKGPSSQSYGFSNSHIWMWELDCEESWALKNWCFWTVLLKKILESSLDSKEIKSVNPQGKSVLNIHWKGWCWSWNSNTLATWCEELTLGKDPDAGKDWRQEEKGVTEDETVGWHHRLDGHESEQAPGAGDGQGGLVCCSPWGRKESDMTEQLSWLTHLCIWSYFHDS